MAHFAKMIDMAKTPEQINKDLDDRLPMSERSKASIVDDLPKYPYGLCITIETEQLEKLGIDDDCEVGDMIHLCAMAKVTSISKREKEGGEGDVRIELQITHLASENEDEEGAETMSAEVRAKKRYGGDDAKATDEDAGDAGEMHLGEKDYKAA